MSNSCYCNGIPGTRFVNFTKEQRIKLLKYAYGRLPGMNASRYPPKGHWFSPSKLISVPGDGFRGPIQPSPLHYSGTDGWGATLAQPTMDNLSGFGCNVGTNGFSAKHGYCLKTTCNNACNVKCSGQTHNCCKKPVFPVTNLPELPGLTITSAYQYKQEIRKKYGKNATYCDGCVTNSQNDPHFINSNEGFFFKN